MGLRGKITGLFILCFGFMLILVVVLVKNSMRQEFLDIAHKQAIEQMHRLARNLNGELSRLGQVTSEWENRDDIYNYAKRPDKKLIEHQIAPSSLKELDLKLFAIFDTQNKIVASVVVNLINGRSESAAEFDPVLVNVRSRIEDANQGADKACSIDISIAGPIFLCWKSIRKSDLSGNAVGTIVLGRLMNSALLSRIQIQSNIDFNLSRLPVHEEESAAIPKNSIEAEKIEFSKTEPGVLSAMLNNLLGQPILKVRLRFPAALELSGESLTRKILRIVLLIMVVGAGLLLFGVYYLVVHRIKRMEKNLSSIWRDERWVACLELPVMKDEISDLSHTVNRMLALIHKQIVMLESIALTDPLTQIANRRVFDERLAVELSLHKRNQVPLSLLIIDIDYFKRYNDFYGHPAGDDVLKTIGQLLSHVACRPSDLPARIDGAGFAVILHATDLDGACHVAELFSTKLAELRLAHEDSPVSDYVTLCIGVTTAGKEDVATLTQRAEKAMYNAKQSGRDKICVLSGVI